MIWWLFCATCLAIDKQRVQKAACALESFVVEEAAVKRSLIEILEDWDRNDNFHVAVLNGYFATGKTYLSKVLAELLADGGNPVEIFQDSLGSAKDFHKKTNDLLAQNRNKDQKFVYPTLIFDDLPCWKDKTRVIKTLERCMQFPEKCRGALFLITSNDGWCDHDYCNYNVELDRLLGNLAKTERELGEADSCDDVKKCVIEGVQISKEECEFRGCCCEGSGGFCDRCMVKKSDYRLFDKLRKASAERSSQYIVSRMNEYSHLTVLGHNAYWSIERSQAHFAKLIERMLTHSVTHDSSKKFAIQLIYPNNFPKQLAELATADLEGEMARRLRQLSQSIVRGPIRGECGGVCAKIKQLQQKLKVPEDSKWSLYMWCEADETTECMVRQVVVPWKNPKGEDYLSKSFQAHLGESIKSHLSGFFGQLHDLVNLYLRKRRPVAVMQSLDMHIAEARNMMQRDAEELTGKIDAVVKRWKVDCPHLRIHKVLVISPVRLPAECDENRFHAEVQVVPEECTLYEAPKLGAFCEPRALVPNPFYGSIVLQLGGYSILNPVYWVRDQHQKRCDSMPSLNILIATVIFQVRANKAV
eukprot:GEMP01028953.1.p1 GENE.GEMP01028953.1~~GEMP01028953.1.p1  ORF type:complete len:586 (+),score=112.77 GEMP01028953.1:26-1783(+)